MAGENNAKAILIELTSKYKKEIAGCRRLREQKEIAERKIKQAQNKKQEAILTYSDVKVSLRQIETELQALTNEAIELNNRLEKRRNTQDDSDMQERQNAKQRLMQIKQQLIDLDNQKTICERRINNQLEQIATAENMAAQYKNLLSNIHSGSLLKHKEMQDCIANIDQNVMPAYKKSANEFSNINTTRFKGESSVANQTVHQKENDADRLRTSYGWLARDYQNLANAAATALANSTESSNEGDNGVEDGSGSNAANASMGGKSRGMGERGKQLAVGAMVAASMVTGAAFHATRPASTFDSSHTPMQVMEERWDGIQDSLTPDDYVSDLEKRRELDEWTAPQKRLRR